MGGIFTEGMMTTGHGGFPSVVAGVSTAPNILTEGKRPMRQGDFISVHCDDDSCHAVHCLGSKPNILINGVPVAMFPGPCTCGDAYAMGTNQIVL